MKKKTLITVLVALVVFALGATCVFADSTAKIQGEWLPDYSKVTYKNVPAYGDVTLDAERAMSDGLIVATPDDSEYEGLAASCDLTPVFYFDFSGATLSGLKGNYATKAQYDSALAAAQGKVTVATPSYVKNAATAAKTYDVALAGHGWKITIKDNYAADSTAVTVTGTLEATADVKGTPSNAYAVNNAVITKTVSVGQTAEATAFYKDEVKSDAVIVKAPTSDVTVTENVVLNYTGDAHKIVNTVAKDHTIAWSVRNANGTYDAVAGCPELKNAGDEAVVRATETWVETTTTGTTNHKSTFTFNFKVTKSAAEPTYSFTKGNGTRTGIGATHYDYELTPEQAADPAAFVEFKNGFSKTDAPIGNPDADLDTIKAFFTDRYDITVTKNAIDPTIQKWEIEDKTFTASEAKAFAKKYETFLANYAFVEGDILLWRGERTTVSVKVTGEPVAKVDEINFVNAPNVTYKAKKIKKKAKSFTVEAKAESGNAIKYSVDSPSSKITIDSATGKITVAKKLKKGTYKVVVKAKTEAGNGYAAAKAERTITIKIKK